MRPSIDPEFRNKQWRSFGYKMLTKQQCLDLLDYRKVNHREPRWIDESTPNAIHIIFVDRGKLAVYNLEELQKLVQEVDRD